MGQQPHEEPEVVHKVTCQLQGRDLLGFRHQERQHRPTENLPLLFPGASHVWSLHHTPAEGMYFGAAQSSRVLLARRQELLILCFPAHASASLQNLDCLQPVTAALAGRWEAGEPPTAAGTPTVTAQAGTYPSRLPSEQSGAHTGRPGGGSFGRGTPCTSCCWHTTGTRGQGAGSTQLLLHCQ